MLSSMNVIAVRVVCALRRPQLHARVSRESSREKGECGFNGNGDQVWCQTQDYAYSQSTESCLRLCELLTRYHTTLL